MRWTTEEENYLKEIYKNNSKEFIIKQLNMPWTTICRKAIKLNLHRDPELINQDRKIKGPRADSYTTEEDNLLKEIYENNSKEFILPKFKRSWASIRTNALRLGLKRNPEIVKQEMIEGGKSAPDREDIWTTEEDNLIREIYEHNSNEYITAQFKDRTWKAIRERAIKLELKRNQNFINADIVQHNKKTMISRYGVEHALQLESAKEKFRQTNIERRGVEYPTQSKEVQEKVQKTVQKKYGVYNIFQSEDIKEKITKTNIKKYGVESPQQNAEIREKTEETNLKRYGVENPFQLTDRVKKGMLKKYGKDNPLKVPEIKEKVKKTNLERYGFTTPAKNLEIRKKLSETLRSDEVREKISLTLKKKGYVEISNEEKEFLIYLKKIDPDIKTQQLHPTTKHLIDFYSPKHNLYIQYDGTYWHGKTSSPQFTKQTVNIEKIKEKDDFQNKNIPNIVRFWSDDIKKAIENNTIISFTLEKIKEKKKTLPFTCHQYRKKMEWYNEDLDNLHFNPDYIQISDFILSQEKLDIDIIEFIKKYEWLGNIGNNPRWCFTARYKDYLGGVVLIGEPTAYSKILGKDTPTYEALIQRGATASWTPKNLGSRLIMFSCKWMVQNTTKRAFIGYADPRAGERGIIYQACNFDYLGNNFGGGALYTHPKINRTFSSQYLSRTSTFKSWCLQNKINLEKEWFKENGFKNLETIPTDIKNRWYTWIKKIIAESEKTITEKKLKYVNLIGKNKREKKYLQTLKTYQCYPYIKTYQSSRAIGNTNSIPESSGKTRSRKTVTKIQFLIDNYGKMSRPELARELNETPRWIKRQLYILSKEGKIKKGVYL